jgi:SNF2 family DNA or RNA helicase
MERKIPAFPLLEPLSRATATTLKPLHFNDSDFLEIDLNDKSNFVVQPVALRRITTQDRLLTNEDVKTVQTEDGLWWRDERYLTYTSRNARDTWLRRIPEHWKENQFSSKTILAGTDYSALVMHHVWRADRLLFLSEIAFLHYSILLKSFLLQTKAALIVAQWKHDKTMPEMPEGFIDHPDLPLADYQKVGLAASLASSKGYALFIEQGLGKTAIIVARTCLEGHLKRQGKLPGDSTKGMFRTLIICPRQVRMNWQREYRRFATRPGKTVILKGSALARTQGMIQGVRDEKDCDWSACIISIDTAWRSIEIIKKCKWDLIILDESHKIKNDVSHRFRNLKLLDEQRARSKQILTGTPIANYPWDIWTQLEFLCYGTSGFRQKNSMKRTFGRWSKRNGQSSVAVLQGIQNVPLIQERLARLAFTLTRGESGMKLPPKVFDVWEVEMTKKQAKVYRDVAMQLVTEIESMEEEAEAEGRVCIVEHILTKLLRLAQVTSGHLVTTDIAGGAREITQLDVVNPKVEAVLELLENDWENDKNSKAVVWCHFVEDIRILSETLAAKGINHVGYHRAIDPRYRVKDAAAAEDVVNLDPECKILIANAQSAGVGQNYIGFDREHPERLSTYVDHHIYFSRNWSSIDRRQSEDRSMRLESRMPLRITDLIVPGTIDPEMVERVQGKIAMAMTIQDVRHILDKVLEDFE